MIENSREVKMTTEGAIVIAIIILAVIIAVGLAFLLVRLAKSDRKINPVLTVILILVVIGAGYALINGGRDSFLKADLTPDSQEKTDYWPRDTMILQEINDLEPLQEKSWKKLSPDEKVAALQKVADIESRHLGIDEATEIKVKRQKLPYTRIGQFNPTDQSVAVNSIYLDQGTPYLLINTTCHEVYHGYEMYLVDAMADRKISRKQHTYDKAQQYLNEFSNYKDGSADFAGYYGQACEADARTYAEDAVVSYRTQINAHYGRNAINNKQKKYLIKDPGTNEMFYVMPDLDNVDGTNR